MRDNRARWLVNITWHTAVFSSLYAWKALGVSQMGNVFIFLAWCTTALMCATFFITSKNAKPKIEKGSRGLNAFGLCCLIALCAFLVWYSHFVIATFLVIGIVSSYGYGQLYDADGNLIRKEVAP